MQKKAKKALDKFKKDYNRKVDYMIEGWHRAEYAKKELSILKEKIDKEKDPKMRNLLIARYGYLEKEAYPYPTLLDRKNPQVQGAGIIEIRGGKIYKIDNASGHFQPGTESLKRTEEVFREKIPSKYFSNDFEGFKTYDNK